MTVIYTALAVLGLLGPTFVRTTPTFSKRSA